MSYEITGQQAIITGKQGPYGNMAKGADYGRNAAANHIGYINEFRIDTTTPKPDVFTKSSTPEEMMAEIKKLADEKIPPIDFTLKYSPKKNTLTAFFARLFTGSAIDKQALIGFSYEAMGKRRAMSVTEADKVFEDKAFEDINANLTTKAFDVNNDGKIDVSEEAVSTVIADVLSKDNSTGLGGIEIKKADGSYTNNGENKMMAFLNEKNLPQASKIVSEIHTKLGLDKAQEKFFKNLG